MTGLRRFDEEIAVLKRPYVWCPAEKLYGLLADANGIAWGKYD